MSPEAIADTTIALRLSRIRRYGQKTIAWSHDAPTGQAQDRNLMPQTRSTARRHGGPIWPQVGKHAVTPMMLFWQSWRGELHRCDDQPAPPACDTQGTDYYPGMSAIQLRSAVGFGAWCRSIEDEAGLKLRSTGIIIGLKPGTPIMNFLSGDGESIRLGP
jgi:hypothetical protein